MKYKKYLLKHPLTLISSILLGVIATVLWVYYALVIGDVIDAIGKTRPEQYGLVVLGVIIFVIIIRLLSAVGFSIRSIYINQTINEIRNDYLSTIYRKQTMPDKGQVLSHISHDLNIIKERYLMHLSTMITDLISFLLSSYFLLRINVTITIVLYIVALLVLGFPSLFHKIIQKCQDQMSQSSQLFVDKIQDDMNGFETVQDYHISAPLEKETRHLGKKLTQITTRSETIQAAIGETAHLFVTLLGAVGFLLGTYFVMIGDITYGEMVAIVQLSNTLVSPIDEMTRCIPQMIAGKKQLNSLLDKISETNISVTSDRQSPVFQIESIELKNVSLALGQQTIIDQISCRFEKGKKYLIVGKTGSGKSTLLKLIACNYPQYEGEILFNQTSLKDIDKKELPHLMTKMNQFPYLFKKSIRENIRLYRQIDDQSIQQALADVQLENLSDQLDHTIQTDTYSGGEKQRIAFCRMLVQRNQICLLDEATSALDIKTANIIENKIHELDTGILICISHHLNPAMLKQFDEIIIMDHGKIIEQANYESLHHKEYLSIENR